MSVEGAIALCVCRHKLCGQCHIVGNHSEHGRHNDLVFGNKGVYFVILFIWIWSFAPIQVDALPFKWSNTMYGCDVVYDGHTSYGRTTNIVINLLIIFVSYGIVARRLVIDQREAILTITSPTHTVFTKHIKMLFSLSIVYTICLIPVSVLGWGMFGYLVDHHIDQEVRNTIQAISSCFYWSIYGEFLSFVIFNCSINLSFISKL